jgi:tetratricopeptide (TPR) repeat protein
MLLRTIGSRYCIVILIAVISFMCLPASAASTFKLTRLPSGKQIKLLGVGTVLSSSDKKKSLMLQYETDKNMNDKQGLAQEADDIWDLFKIDIEQSGLNSAIISVNSEPTGWPVKFNRTYNFVLEKDTHGEWHCTNDKLVTIGTPAKIAYRQALQIVAKGHYKEALASYDKSIDLNPNYAQAYVDRGAIYFSLHQLDKSLHDLNKAIGLNPDSAEAYINRAAVYVEIKQFQKAIDDCSKVITLSTAPAILGGAYANRGEAYVKIGNYEKAIDDLTKAITSNPQPAESYYYRSVAYEKIGKKELAIKDRAKAIKLGYHEGENTTIIEGH